MKISDIVYVFSIQHTGTWFTIKFLQNFFPDAIEVPHLIDGRKTISGPTVLHSHFPILHDLDMRTDMDWHSRRKLTMKDRSVSLRTIDLISAVHKVVIPVRDPLAAILTREARHPDLRHFFIVDGFIELAQRYQDNPNIAFLPIDLPWDQARRKEALTKIVQHCDIEPDLYDAVLDRISLKWMPENPTPGNRFKQLYRNKDIDQIRYLLGPKWAEVEYLKNTAAIIHPFLTSVGYEKGDMGLW